MKVHRTTFVFYDDDADIPSLIEDMKRSYGNRQKIVHKIDSSGDVIQSFEWNDETESLDVVTASRDELRRSKEQRKWVEKKKPFMIATDINPDERAIICNCLGTTFLRHKELSDEEKSDIALIRKQSTHKAKLDVQLIKAGLPKETVIKKTNGVEKFFSEGIIVESR